MLNIRYLDTLEHIAEVSAGPSLDPAGKYVGQVVHKVSTIQAVRDLEYAFHVINLIFRKFSFEGFIDIIDNSLHRDCAIGRTLLHDVVIISIVLIIVSDCIDHT